jgi:predicted GIY-YIG superfamily endonuclease
LRFELRPGKPEYFPFGTQLRTKAGINGLKNFHYVYILVSESDETRHYTGVTENLEARLKAHNNGQDPHTAKYRPWQIETAIAFRSREKANHWTSTKLRLPLNASF